MATRRRASRSSLTGNITDLQRRVRYLQSKPSPSKLANQVVTRTAIQPRAVSTDQIALAAITNDQVAADAIRQEQLAELSVGNPELQNNAVLNRNIAVNAVTQESIQINSVGSPEIIENAVGSTEIAPNAVTSSEIAPGAVGTAELADLAVTTQKLDSNAVTFEKLGPNAVVVGKIAPDTITKGVMQRDSVGSREIINGSVNTAELDTNSVTTVKINAGAVTAEKIANGSVTEAKIGFRSVSGTKINDSAVTFRTIAAGTAALIVGAGLVAGTALVKSGAQLNVSLGTGSQQAARGNHTHSVNVAAALSGLNRHSHTATISSSILVKKDITTHSPKNIKNLLKLEPKKYKYKRSHRGYQESTNREWMHGYLIEELLDLGFSEPVAYNKKGEPEKLDYGLMAMLVLELVKVQQSEIDSLKEEIQEIKGQL